MRTSFAFLILLFVFACHTPGKHATVKTLFDGCKQQLTSTIENRLRLDTTITNLVAGEEITVVLFKTPNTPYIYLMGSGSWGHTYTGSWSGEMHEKLEVVSVVIRVPDHVKPDDSVTIHTSTAYKEPVHLRGFYVQRHQTPAETYPAYFFYPALYDFLYEYSGKPAYINKDSINQYLSDSIANRYCGLKHIDHKRFVHTFKQAGDHNTTWKELEKRSASLRFMNQSTTYEASEMDTMPLTATAPDYIFFPGDTVNIRVNNNTGKPFTMEIWQTATNYVHQKISSRTTCTDSVITLFCKDLPKGFLMVKFRGANQASFEMPLVINRRANAGVVILAPSATWMAYNAYQGQSLYRNIIDKNPVYFTSYQKPLTSVYFKPVYGKHDFIIVQNIYDWFDNNYGAVIVPDHYLQHHPGLVAQARTIIPAYHCEYFSVEMYNNLQNLSLTRNLLCIGANQVYWRIAWTDNLTYECHKDATLFGSNKLIGGYWSGLLNSEAALLGSSYCGMVEAAPYQVTNATHFLFKGCALKNGDLFGEKGIDGLPICGDETDRMNKLSPKNTVMLAKGTNKDNLGGEIVYIPRGEFATLNTSAITSGSGLGTDKVFTTLIRNFMDTHHKKPVR